MAQPETDAYYRQLCEHLGIALIATDTELNIRTWNDAAARLFGAAAERMIGTPLISVVPQERRRLAERLVRRAVDTGETLPFEFHYRNPEGKRRELAVLISPVVSGSGERIGAAACIRDITHRIAMENELFESRKMVALGELAGAIAHHFNNILGGVITSVDYAGSSENPLLMQRVLNQTGKALLRATSLVNGLLAFSEGYQRSDGLSDFTELVMTFADEIEREIEGTNIKLECNARALPILPVGQMQVKTILRNITQNAIEAMPEGGTLGIHVIVEDEWVIAEISDTGIGLDEAAQSRIFEPFWTTKRGPGEGGREAAGLGLAIAHGLAKVIGGKISVSSEPDKGSRFKVYIPRTAD